MLCMPMTAKAAANNERTQPITLNTTVKDHTENLNTKYTFSIPRSGRLTTKLGFTAGSANYWGQLGTITLYNSDGVKVGNSIEVRDDTKDTDYGIGTIDITGGAYYYYLSTQDFGYADYELTATFEDSMETVPDLIHARHNSDNTAIPLSLNATYTGHIAYNGTMDMYTFPLSKGQIVNVTNSNASEGVRMQLVNANNTVNVEVEIENTSGNFSLFCPPGQYYLRVEKRKNFGTYTVNVAASDIPVSKVSKLKKKTMYTSTYNYSRHKYIKKFSYTNLKVKFGLQSTDYIKGYQIQYAKSKNFKKGKKSVTFENSDSLSSTKEINMGKKKGTYYVRIRTYATDNRNDKYYSNWSNVKKIKVR